MNRTKKLKTNKKREPRTVKLPVASIQVVRNSHLLVEYPDAPDKFRALKQPGFETPKHLRGV